MFDSQLPSFHAAFGEATLQVVLSDRQTPRLTWLAEFFNQPVEPVVVKIATNRPAGPCCGWGGKGGWGGGGKGRGAVGKRAWVLRAVSITRLPSVCQARLRHPREVPRP